MINKDVQDIIEGVHYFLSESLSCEQLTGKAECLRNALVLQLEALAVTYPTLKLHKGPSYPYLNMGQGDIGGGGGSGSGGGSGTNSAGGSGSGTVQAKRPPIANESSGSVYSNSSNSGDPFTFPPNAASLARTAEMRKTKGDSVDEDAYEELDHEFLKMQVQKYSREVIGVCSQPSPSSRIMASPPSALPSDPTTSSSNPEPIPEVVPNMDDPEENYMITVPNVAFSSLIAKSEKHGELLKKTKGILRNLKKYHGVVANRLLYLYLKETDEIQKKVIDLTQFTARVATGDDFNDQRKKDAAFELVGVGRKTHTFVARTAKDKNQWLAAIERVSTAKLGDIQDFTTVLKQDFKETSSLILPPKPPPPFSVKSPLEEKEASSTKEVPEEAPEEVYEEMDVELPPDSKPYQGFIFHKPNGGASTTAASSHQPFPTFASPPVPPSTSTSKSSYPEDVNDDKDYEEADPLPALPPAVSAPGFTLKKSPPDRPPLPSRLQHVVALQRIRPLPNTPSSSSVVSGEVKEEDGDEIYCVIDEDTNDGDHTMAHTIAPSLPTQLPPTPPLRNSSRSEISSLSNDTQCDELYDEPDLNVDPSPSQLRMASKTVPCTPPKLPPRGIPTQFSADDTEYKVPQSFNLNTEYQVPQSNPVQANSQVKKGDILTYQVPPSNVVAVTSTTQPLSEGTCNGREGKMVSDSFRALTNLSHNFKSSEKKNPVWLKKGGHKDEDKDIPDKINLGREQNEPKSSQGYSVKDIISMMNKNNAKEVGVSANTISNRVQTSSTKDSQQTLNSVTTKQKDGERTNLVNEQRIVKPKLPKPQEDEIEDQNKEDSGQMESRNPNTSSNNPCENQEHDRGEWYIAKFSFVASIPQSIGFDRGDEILIVDKSGDSGWWTAVIKGRTGFVPKEYIRKKE